MPLPSLGVQILPSGISAPDFAAILLSLQESMQEIYGADIYIAPDSQDGQLIALIASAINDVNNQAIRVYQSFSPSYAQGVGLSSVVKINGIQRRAATFSTAVGLIVGQVGTVIINGQVSDENGNLWNLPVSVTIPISGDILVTVTAQEEGALVAPIGTINKIATPVFGWQSFESTTAATAGDPVETDSELRQRQSLSTSMIAITPLAAMLGALANLPGVGRVRVFENPTGIVDGDGLPAHSISVVIEGGDLVDIAETIGQKKTPGAATYGSTSQDYTDPLTGITYTINFWILATPTITVEITGDALPGYNVAIEAEIKQALADYINGLAIGQDVDFSRVYVPAYLNGTLNGTTYEITDLQIGKNADPPSDIDIPIAFNEAAICDPDVDITINIT